MINLPEIGKKRIVIIGGGFAGLALIKELRKSDFQIVLLDKNNYHQFQPLFYQVAMSGLEPSSISFPFRKLFQKEKHIYFRVAEVKKINPEEKRLDTDFGIVNYDYLVIATGADTNFFGNEGIARKAIPMKSVSEALFLRNRILADYEEALLEPQYDDRQPLLDIVVVGGGPTGVEVAGSLAEMKKFILPKDYPELNPDEVDIFLMEGLDRLLAGMSEKSGKEAKYYLENLGVNVMLHTMVTGFDGRKVITRDGQEIEAFKVIWAAGVKGNYPEGLPEEARVRGNRLQVDDQLRVAGTQDIFALGDVAYLEEDAFPKGHPQVAQVAIQMGKFLARKFKGKSSGKGFSYNDLGSMATIGRNKAVVDLPRFHFKGFFAWFVWLVVHLRQILGIKNKFFVFLNWVWSYLFYDQSLRLIIRPRVPKSVNRGKDKEVKLVDQ